MTDLTRPSLPTVPSVSGFMAIVHFRFGLTLQRVDHVNAECKWRAALKCSDLGGWKNAETILKCYQWPDTETQREALRRRKPILGRTSGPEPTQPTDTPPANLKEKSPPGLVSPDGATAY